MSELSTALAPGARAPSVVVPIGQMSAITGLSQRAIRYYEERGLVEPYRDRHRRRGYDRATHDRLALIALLRSCGIGLQEVADLLKAFDKDSGSSAAARLQELLGGRRQALEMQIDALDAVLQTLSPPAPPGGKLC